jgi:hypothetical protein
MFNKCPRGYYRQMNEHLVSTEADGYTFTFGISRSSLRIAGLCAVVAAAFLAVLINATEPFRVPLGIAMGVLVITLLTTYAVNSSSRTHELQPETAKRARGPRMMVGKIMGKGSLAAELALLAELHGRGALTDEEFSAGKRRILGDS